MVDQTNDNNNGDQEQVSYAFYPISQPVVTILRAALIPPQETTPSSNGNTEDDEDDDDAVNSTNSKVTLQRESMEDALEHLIRNCFVAMDAMYFSTPGSQRKKSSFQHRLCIRISTCQKTKTLSITDLGGGMTRSDLINSIGVGSRLSSNALNVSRALSHSSFPASGFIGKTGDTKKHGKPNDDSDDNDDDDDNETSSTTSNEDEDSEEDVVEDSGNPNEGKSNDPVMMDMDDTTTSSSSSTSSFKMVVVPCEASDIGGFYAALCSLGVGVEIGTKSKFDDYYKFNLERDLSQDAQNAGDGGAPSMKDYSHFSISRPMAEGVKPTALNGYDTFSDVRGESGTRVTITLNDNAIDAGFLKEEEVLKPLLEKILEKSPYSVVLAGCSSEEEKATLIDASQKEMEEIDLANQNGENGDDIDIDEDIDPVMNGEASLYNSVKERSKYIPLRLSMGERKMLRLVEASMTCCDYTTEVDKPFKSSARRTHAQLKGVTSVLRGMVTACDYAAGQKILEEDNYSDYEKYFRQMFEIARRHKIMNPEKMRTEYGKLIYLLQDAVSPSVQPHLSFSCKGPIETVYKFLEDRQGTALLDDKLIDVATREILAGKKSRNQITNEIRRKEKAVEKLKQTHRSSNLSSEDIHLCLYSICDNDSYLNSNRVPIDKVIDYLQKFFSPDKIEDGYSLSIVSGQDGARLSHSHERQYYFALQSLTLWRDIIDDMFRLWAMAEEDLLSESITYTSKDTGQGIQRVQQSPLTYKSMQQILIRVQGKVKQWIGSNVIHLGDHNVPNALTFIDKYTQVPRILGPIVSCLENVEKLCEENDGIDSFISSGFGGVEQLKKDILYDFFKSAFDGSGADNFYDAGSCIDGRLTSAWNWCSQLPSKPFYCIFKLTGFTGFDGDFK